MNYITISKRFWTLHNLLFFSSTEIALFFYLLEKWNTSIETGLKTDYFIQTNKKVMAELSISFHTFQNARKTLQEAGIIDFISVGGSAFVKYNFKEVTEPTIANFAKVSATDDATVKEENPPTPPKEENNNNNITPILPDGSMSPQPPKKNFVKPTIEEIRAFIAEKNLTIDAEKFYYYYEAQGWYCSKGNKMKSWQAACFNWQKSEYPKRQAAKIIHKENETQYEKF